MTLCSTWLIQRCHIQTPLADTTTRLTPAVKLDYMGSAEFEWGALPQSLRRLQANQANAQTRLIKTLTDEDSPLRVYSTLTDAEFIEYTSFLVRLREESFSRGPHLKERSEFSLDERKPYELLRKSNSAKAVRARDYADLWWDLDNDTMFSFRKEFMNRLPDYLKSSWDYMDAEKAKKA